MASPSPKRSRSKFQKKGRGPSRKEVGSVVILALTILTPILVAGGSMMSALNNYSREVRTRSGLRVAQATAASGAHETLYILDQDPSFRGSHEITFDNGFANVLVEEIEATEGSMPLLQLRAEGWHEKTTASDQDDSSQWHRSVVIAEVAQRTKQLAFHQTVYLGNPYEAVEIGFGNVEFKGQDATPGYVPEDPDANEGEGDHVYSVGSPTDLDALNASFSTWKKDDGDELGLTPELDIPRMISDFGRAADLVLPETTLVATGNMSPSLGLMVGGVAADSDEAALWGATSGAGSGLVTDLLPEGMESAVVHAPGNLSITGVVEGAGVLVVDGDLNVNGDFVFDGLIIVRGKVNMMGCVDIDGGLWVEGDSADQPYAPGISMCGEISVEFTEEAAAIASTTISSGIELVSWYQDVLDESVTGSSWDF